VQVPPSGEGQSEVAGKRVSVGVGQGGYRTVLKGGIRVTVCIAVVAVGMGAGVSGAYEVLHSGAASTSCRRR